MNIEEIVKMPEPAGVMNTGTQLLRAFTAEQLRAHSEAVAAAVAKRCIELCLERERRKFEWLVSNVNIDVGPLGCADAIRREFVEVSQ